MAPCGVAPPSPQPTGQSQDAPPLLVTSSSVCRWTAARSGSVCRDTNVSAEDGPASPQGLTGSAGASSGSASGRACRPGPTLKRQALSASAGRTCRHPSPGMPTQVTFQGGARLGPHQHRTFPTSTPTSPHGQRVSPRPSFTTIARNSGSALRRPARPQPTLAPVPSWASWLNWLLMSSPDAQCIAAAVGSESARAPVSSHPARHFLMQISLC